MPAATEGVTPSVSVSLPSANGPIEAVPMYAVIRTGGKQYRVAKDDVITVETIPAETGAEVTFEDVLMVGTDEMTNVGAPVIPGAEVTATVLEHKLGDKVLVFKKRRRHNYRRKNGHRQPKTVLKITGISVS